MSVITDKFQLITGYDINRFMSNFVYFVDNYYRNIVDYFNGSNIDKNSFNYLDMLVVESGKINALIELNENRFDNAEYWDLFDKFSSIQVQLDTTNNLSRWLRSSRANRFDATIKVEYIQKQLESLEQISKKSGDISPQDDWTQIAINNDLNEEKYTSAGGILLSISFSNSQSFNIKNIVDTLRFENLYGKDIQKKFEIVNNDLVTLSGIDAITQTFGTIFDTIKGSIPEFPEDGTSSESIGSNVNTVNYPSIFRNLLNMFQKDDRFASVDLVDLYRQDDSIFLKIQAKTKIGDVLLNKIPL